ncbi:hypothetical protein O181_068564 [Austropuccinia psidii MF-1]|uniref:RNase H type-1 domain-containing protein n=1 Tax=Austropuccinia psidii MF-1 TaxID=1389203 RepID=A0A9Q3I7P3_9BASI|nr:hypothetical protein [Austropuccinia psidii MF-1]
MAKKTPPGPAMAVSIAELQSMGISLAIYIIEEIKNNIIGTDIFIFTDNTGILHQLRNHWAAKTGQKLLLEITDKWNSISNHFNLYLNWFPGHQNIIGKEREDTPASQAQMNNRNSDPKIRIPLLFSTLKTLEILKRPLNIIPIPKLKANDYKTQAPEIIHQLLSEHCPLNVHLYKFKRSNTPICACFNKEETTMNLLLKGFH